MRSLLFLSIIILGFRLSTSAQQFKKGDRVCFVGNSITHNGDFWHNVQLYYNTRYPQLGVAFFNCGISGDVTAGILRRMDEDILIHNPTWAVIMIGMNDVNRPLYDAKRRDEPGIKEKQQEALVVYKRNLDSIINIFLAKGVKVILQTPSIYDQTSKMASNNLFGANDALKTCAGYIKEFAAKYKLQVVDYWTMLSTLNAQVQQTDSMATLISQDRVHPAGVGHLLMGWEFLKTIKAPAVVANIVVDQDTKMSQGKSANCVISDLKRDRSTISFTVLEKALPFPVREDQQKALELVPFTDNLNRDIVQFNYLDPGNYVLQIDDVEIGKYFSGELQRGLNLALVPNSPQYQQALKVQALYQKHWKLEGQMRLLRLMEYRHLNVVKGKEKLENVQHYFDTALVKKPDTDGMKKNFIQYLKDKPKEAEIMQALKGSLDSLPLLNKTVAHKFVLKKQ
ncbi:SGNH/GDSL hydrolase family protein [Chitinophaga niabensis]|uniref:Lysophospholipase L1 n=1 Tax=Chitinophaga niabensis TaxID=536979 RepID=A0A1N6K799_9BACT|nr:SGNH/GDSL hydrolase family protein [Chitinophaga niabensis]SIO52469.1 Lysophospholipase L1 [Chitinophaga niabensis]